MVAVKENRSLENETIYKTYTGEHALLCGNSINQLINSEARWSDLLQSLCEMEGIKIDITPEKSFPLVFEEILFSSRGSYKNILKRLKEHIASTITGFKTCSIHKSVLDLPITEILTTNYDYTFETTYLQRKLTPADRPLFLGDVGSREYRYSLYRKKHIGPRNIWHIHGELDNGFSGKSRYPEQSIMIGNEHYGDYHRRIHEYIRPSGGLKAGLSNKKDSWVKRFFTHNLHIVGLSLDYTETHLWWLLNYRARKIKEHVTLPNSITFYYPSFSADEYKHKVQLLKALKVVVKEVPIEIKNWKDDRKKFILYWKTLLEDHLRKLDSKGAEMQYS